MGRFVLTFATARISKDRDKTTACISMDRGIAVPTEGGGGGAFAEKSTMGLAFEMAGVVLNSACASSSFSDTLLPGCFRYHALPTRRLPLKSRPLCAPGPPSPHLPLEAHAQAFVIQERSKISQPSTPKRRTQHLIKLNRKPTDQSVSGFNLR